MEVSVTALRVKLDEEQLDQMVVDHCKDTIQTILRCINIERELTRGELPGYRDVHLENIRKYERDLEALKTVVEYFSGDIYNGDASE